MNSSTLLGTFDSKNLNNYTQPVSQYTQVPDIQTEMERAILSQMATKGVLEIKDWIENEYSGEPSSAKITSEILYSKFVETGNSMNGRTFYKRLPILVELYEQLVLINKDRYNSVLAYIYKSTTNNIDGRGWCGLKLKPNKTEHFNLNGIIQQVDQASNLSLTNSLGPYQTHFSSDGVLTSSRSTLPIDVNSSFSSHNVYLPPPSSLPISSYLLPLPTPTYPSPLLTGGDYSLPLQASLLSIPVYSSSIPTQIDDSVASTPISQPTQDILYENERELYLLQMMRSGNLGNVLEWVETCCVPMETNYSITENLHKSFNLSYPGRTVAQFYDDLFYLVEINKELLHINRELYDKELISRVSKALGVENRTVCYGINLINEEVIKLQERRIYRYIPLKVKESEIRDNHMIRLTQQGENPARSVPCPPYGICDIMTETKIIEVKRWALYKHAVGQILAYGACHPEKHKVIHLFDKGKINSTKQQEIISFINSNSIYVTYEEE